MRIEVELDPDVLPDALPAMIVPSRTALLIIDAQQDFISPTGAAGAWGIDLAIFEAPLRRIRTLVAAARAAGATPVFVRVVTREATDAGALRTLHARKGRSPGQLAICRAGTQGADYYGVAPEEGDWHVEKPLYSSFVGTDLDARLRGAGLDTLVVAGFTTECCVSCTVRDAFHRDYDVFVVRDACAAYEESLHVGALQALAKNCAMLTQTEAVLAAWR